jgi:DnaJ-class molecular chaperone
VRCQNCSGSGKVDCGSCDRGIVRCSSCNGKGYLKWSCPDCRGTGIIRSR